MSLLVRFRSLLKHITPMKLGLLGLLALPTLFFDGPASRFLELFWPFWWFFLWPFVEPIVDAVLRRGVEDDQQEPTDWIHMGSWREYAVALLGLPLAFINPLSLTQDLLQSIGSLVALVRHRGSLPDTEGYDQRVSYRLPFEGTWTVVNGSHEREHSHSWYPVNQRYAYDFVITDEEGRSRPEGTSTRVDNYYCHDEPILAPADGVVVDVLDTDLEPSRGGGVSHPLKRDILGNYVVIQHATDEYSTLAHLRPGSVDVKPGDRVERGERIALCGHSGNSSEPHLHFQLQDHPTFEIAAGLPIAFDDLEIESPWKTAGEGAPDEADPGSDDSGDEQTSRSHVTAGQRVTPAGAAGAESERDSEERNPIELTSDVGHSGVRTTFQRLGVGMATGGVIAFLGQLVTSWPVTGGVLAGAALLAVAYWYGFVLRGDQYETRPGWLGMAAGLATVAAVVTLWVELTPTVGIGIDALPPLLFLCGFLVHVFAGEYDRVRRRETFADAGVSW